jgi:carbonic anhydrase
MRRGALSATDELLANNARYADSFEKAALPARPAKSVAVLACMDARLDPALVLGLSEGDAHVIRNAGGLASEDAIRSLVISQRLLGTEEVVLIHHTDCGMESFDDEAVKAQILAETGLLPDFALGAFADAEADVRHTAALIRANPFIPRKNVRGFVYEVESGRLREVPLD